jgi:hypothetical protein
MTSKAPAGAQARGYLENIMQPKTKMKSLVYGRGPGFVVWVGAANSRISGFISWAETGVAELSPVIRDAWHFPTPQAANIAVNRAFGAAIKAYTTKVLQSDA